MVIGREFGSLRGCKYENSTETLDGLGSFPNHSLAYSLTHLLTHSLGKLIVTLPTGAGFGEYAILSTSQKLRSCAAVSSEDDSLLLIMHADLYDKVHQPLTCSLTCLLTHSLTHLLTYSLTYLLANL